LAATRPDGIFFVAWGGVEIAKVGIHACLMEPKQAKMARTKEGFSGTEAVPPKIEQEAKRGADAMPTAVADHPAMSAYGTWMVPHS